MPNTKLIEATGNMQHANENPPTLWVITRFELSYSHVSIDPGGCSPLLLPGSCSQVLLTLTQLLSQRERQPPPRKRKAATTKRDESQPPRAIMLGRAPKKRRDSRIARLTMPSCAVGLDLHACSTACHSGVACSKRISFHITRWRSPHHCR